MPPELELLLTFAFGLALGLVPLFVLASTFKRMIRAADFHLETGQLLGAQPFRPEPPADQTDASRSAAHSAAGRATTAGARDPEGPGFWPRQRHLVQVVDPDENLDLFSDLVPSMGRTSANDSTWKKPCAPCARARALFGRLRRAGAALH